MDEDDDDYEPDFSTAETEEQILNKLDIISPDPEKVNAPDMALGHFNLPQPPPLTLLQATEVGQGTVLRVFGVMQTLEEKIKKTRGGLNRLAASAFDRDAWITILTRLATRTLTGLQSKDEAVKHEPSDLEQDSLANMIRESLRRYIIEDFRKRIDVAIAWLCEEWYNDKVQIKFSENAVLHYEKWVLKVMDGMVPYLDASDKNVLIRFVSEIPGLSPGVLERLKELCRNPATVTIALMSLLFLHMQKPPARHMVLAAVEDIWDTCRSFPFSQRIFLY